MTLRENVLAILRYQSYDKMPVVSFGYWNETCDKWANQGHITKEEADGYKHHGDNSEADNAIMERLGFDFNWNSCVGSQVDLFPRFEKKILEVKEDGSQIIIDENGLIVLEKPGIVSISAEIGTQLMDRTAWEELYLPKLQWDDSRVNTEYMKTLADTTGRQIPIGIHCGSLLGTIRNFMGVEQLSYLQVDDPDFLQEIIDTFAELSYRTIQTALKTGAIFDYAHYWEDICFKNGPLVIPTLFDEMVGPLYKRNSDLLTSYGIDITSLDCDGMIDSLLPTWLENGVNTMFPIEVGTWDASIAPWRKKYGKELRGIGGMNKTLFARDYTAIDGEIERLKELIALGGYIPCPDHRIAPDAIFENVQYYCHKMQALTI